jgi:DNA (cytosine-5)-methyltransferase 1
MASLLNRKLKEHRNSPRIYIDEAALFDFAPSLKRTQSAEKSLLKYNRVWNDDSLVLELDHKGEYTLSTKIKDGVLVPVLDINNKKLGELFDHNQELRIAIKSGRLTIKAHASETDIESRENDIISLLNKNGTLQVGSLFHGGGFLDVSMHNGFSNAGVKTTTSFAVEMEARYLNASRNNNKKIFNPKTFFVYSDVALVNYNNMPKCSLLLAGLPCTGASNAGKAKNKLEFAESHNSAGACFFSFLNAVKSSNPAVVVIENVKQYLGTASYVIIKSVLGQLGYNLQSVVLNGADYGSFEKRERMVCIAISKGLGTEITFEKILQSIEGMKNNKTTKLKELLDDLPLDDSAWKEVTYLKAKAISDRAAGKGFEMQFLTEESTSCGVIGAGYQKARSTEPRLLHPTNPDLSRLLTPQEHARIKTHDSNIIEGLPATHAHAILGNGVIGKVFEAVGYSLASTLKSISMVSSEDIQQAA